MKRASQVLAAPLVDGRVQFWAVRDDGSLWSCWQRNASKADWILYTDEWAETPTFKTACAAVAPHFGGRLQFWAVDDAGSIWSATSQQDPSLIWNAWTRSWAAKLPTFKTESLAVAPLSDERLQFWAVDADGRIRSCWQKDKGPGGAWTAWRTSWTPEDHAFKAVRVAAAPLADKRLQFWAVDTDGVIWSCTKESEVPSAKWTAWTKNWVPETPAFKAFSFTVVPLADGSLRIWAVDETGEIWSCRQTSGSSASPWTAWTKDWAPETFPFEAASIAAAQWANGNPQFWAVNADGDVWTCRDAEADPAEAWTAFCLFFPMQKQERNMWCWVATAVSVSHFYDPSSTRRQCEVIEKVIHPASCCGDTVDAVCDLGGEVKDALVETGNIGDGSPSWITEEKLAEEIRRGRPVIARMTWNGVSPHYVVVIGCGSNHMVHVKDPWLEDAYISYDELRIGYAASYASGGRWIDTQRTKPAE